MKWRGPTSGFPKRKAIIIRADMLRYYFLWSLAGRIGYGVQGWRGGMELFRNGRLHKSS